MSDSKFSANQIDVEGLSNDPTMQGNLGNSTLVLNDLTDVVVAGSPAVNGQVLTFDGSNWINADVASGLADGWMHLDNGTTLTTPPVGTGANAIAIGNAVDTGTATKNIGIGESITMVDGLTNAIAIGQTITQTSFNSICIGEQVGVTSSFGVAIGYLSTAAGDSIGIGDNADAFANDSIAIGHNAQSGVGLLKSIAIGRGVANSFTFQTRIGDTITAATPGIANVAYEFIAGSGADDVNLNLLDLYGKGKLTLLGDEAQFIFPSYAVTGSPVEVPANSVEGGVIYDSVAKGLEVYDGASWSAIGGGGSVALDDLTDVTLGSPVTDQVLKFDGSNWVSAADVGIFTEDANFNVVGGTGAGSSLDTGLRNVFAGYNAGSSILGATDNVAIGANSLKTTTSGINNLAIGSSAIQFIKAIGVVAIGTRAMLGVSGNSTATNDTVAIGKQAGAYTEDTHRCVFIGSGAGQGALPTRRNTGIENVFIGNRTGLRITSASYNVGIGDDALFGVFNSELSGNNNVAIGAAALVNIETTSNNNVAIGSQSGTNISTGAGNVIIGQAAGPTTNQSNKLFIANSTTDTPLIGGDFIAGEVNIAGNINAEGGTMTGTLIIGDGTNGRSLIIKQAGPGSPAIAGGHPNIKFRNVNDLFTTTIVDEIDLNELVITKSNPTGSPLTETIVKIEPSGNISISGGSNVPTATGHLTRKDYVDSLVVFTEDATGNIVGGTGAGAALTAGASDNFLVGLNAGSALNSEDNNIVIGNNALVESTTTIQSVAIGVSASQYADLSACVAIGHQAFQGVTADTLISQSSVAIGHRAAQYAHGVTDNVIVGREAGTGTATDRMVGDQLTLIGRQAGVNFSSGSFTTAIGYQAMQGTAVTPLTGDSNVAVGSHALFIIEGTANTNVAIGRDTLDVLTTGNQNTALGYNAGATITTGAGNVLLGYLAGPTTNQSNKLYIDNSQTDTPLIGGDFTANTVTINGALTMTGDVNLGDNDHVIFGAGTDLDIYSNGTNSLLKYITGTLFFESASATTVAAFTQTAAKLYFSSSLKLETLTTGVKITGRLDLEAYSEEANSIATTGAVTLNASLATYFYNTATTGIITFTFTGAATTGRVTTITLELFGGGTNAPVWPASVDWPGATEPSWSTGVDVVTFVTRDAGTTWLGMLGGLAFA